MRFPDNFCGFVVAISLGACASAGGAPIDLVGTHWMRVDDDNAAPHFPTLEFADDSAAGFLPGCGPWSAQVRSSGATLTFDDIHPANPRCGAESADAAARSMLHALARTHSSRLRGGELSLLDARGNEVARFAANETEM